MGKINFGRVLMGGLVAGLIINIAEVTSANVFADWYAEVFESLNLPEMTGGDTTALVIGGFVIGIILTWTYAGIRPRFGPGPKTALLAGLVIWLMGWVWQMVVDVATGFYAPGLWMWIVGLLWTFVEVELAALAGASLYKEGTAAAEVPAQPVPEPVVETPAPTEPPAPERPPEEPPAGPPPPQE
jgi:hypothetical protein